MMEHAHRLLSPRLAAPRDSGFTLLELMVTLTVAAVTLGIGVPSFLSIIQNNRAATQTNELVTALNVGRSEAVRRSATITVCSSTTGSTCSGSTDWSDGWIAQTSGGELIRTWPESLPAGAITADVAELRFQPRGTAAAAGVLSIRIPGCTGEQGRNVGVNRAGRIAVTRVDC